jgi:hypothetical protein
MAEFPSAVIGADSGIKETAKPSLDSRIKQVVITSPDSSYSGI